MALFGRRRRAAPAPEVPDPTVEVGDEAAPARPQPPEDPVSFEDYRAALLAAISPQPPIALELLDALGLRLCEDIVADLDLPTTPCAAVDGYAVAADAVATATPATPVRLRVLEAVESPAASGPLLDGTAIRVAAGAPLPTGADAVVPLEQTEANAEELLITAVAIAGQFLRLAGSVISDGAQLLDRGTVLNAGAIGLAAEIGIDKVLVRQPPRVVVLTVGANLVPPGRPLASWSDRYDATTSLIAAAAKADGAVVFPGGTVADDATELTETLTNQLIRADLVVVVGGLAGVLPGVLAALGDLTLRKVWLHPGELQAFALVGPDRTPVVAVPGGASAAFVGYHAFVRPALNRLRGEPDEGPVSRELPARVALHGRSDATELVPARVDRRGVEPVGSPDPASATGLMLCDALIVLPPGTDLVPANSGVEVWVLHSEPT